MKSDGEYIKYLKYLIIKYNHNYETTHIHCNIYETHTVIFLQLLHAIYYVFVNFRYKENFLQLTRKNEVHL